MEPEATPNENQQRKKLHQALFLKAYEQTAHIGNAAKAADIDRWNHHQWMKTDPEYAAQFEQSKLIAKAMLEDEVVRRAVHGVDEPVYYEGKVVGSVKKYSDTLLIFKLKALDPKTYRDHYTMEHTGKDGAPILEPSVWNALLKAAKDSDDGEGNGGAGAPVQP